MRISRLDFRTIRLDQVETTSQGFLKFPVFAGRTGILTYKRENGDIVKEHRPAEEAFSQKTLESMKSIPVTNNHPEDMLTPENAKEFAVGFGSDSVSVVDKNGNEIGIADDFTKNGKFQKTTVTIFDADTIKDIRNGKLEVSQGYDLELDETPGTFENENFDAIQRDIVFNHLAIVDKGRGGPEVRLRFDRYDAIMVENDQEHNNKKPYKSEDNMAKLKVGDKEFEVEQEVKDALEAERKKMKEDKEEAEKEKDQAEEEKKKAEDRADAAERKNERLSGRNDALEDEVDGLKKNQKTSNKDAEEIAKLVKERRDVEDVANKVLKEEERKDLADKDVMDIKKSVIQASSKKDVNFDGKSNDYVNARFDALKDSIETSSESHNDASDAFREDHENKDDKDKPNWRKSREDSMKKESEAYQTPLGRTVDK